MRNSDCSMVAQHKSSLRAAVTQLSIALTGYTALLSLQDTTCGLDTALSCAKLLSVHDGVRMCRCVCSCDISGPLDGLHFYWKCPAEVLQQAL